MCSKINNIGKNPAKTNKFTGKAIMAAAVMTLGATLGTASNAFAAFTNVTGITTKTTDGFTSTVSNVSGYGASYSVFQANTNWNVSYGGDVSAITSLTAGGQTFVTSGLATNAIRRYQGQNSDQLWYSGAYNTATGSVAVNGPILSGFKQVFDANNVLVGADNIFSNEGNAVGNNTNVDRLDLLFTGGIKASASQAFAVLERGNANDHDAFKIAAITSLDANGNPASYGPLISEADGSYGTTNVIAAQQEVILRENNAITDTLHPSDQTIQGIGGVLIHTSDLVAAGTTIYGYSLFSADVTGTGSNLVNWTNSKYYHEADSTSSGGGLDPIAAISNLYTLSAPVPEPTTAALMTVVAAGSLLRRRRAVAKA